MYIKNRIKLFIGIFIIIQFIFSIKSIAIDSNTNQNYNGMYKCSSKYNIDEANEEGLWEYEITDITKQRMKYSKIYIEKIVDVFNNSVVDLEDELEYKIIITNKIDKKYDNFDVIENISEYVEIVNYGNGILDNNKLKWTITELNSGQTVEIKYKVKVKNNVNLYGKKIISTGTVAGIPSGTITNPINNNFNADEKEQILNNYKLELSNINYKGMEFVANI